MNAIRVIAGAVSTLLSGTALAGIVTLGTPMGSLLGTVMGFSVLPITGGGLLTVAAASLVAGILIVRRKKRR